MRALVTALLAYGLWGCAGDCANTGPLAPDAATGPTTTIPASTPPPPPDVPPDPPRVDQPFDYEGVIGFSLFAGARASCSQVQGVFAEAQIALGPRAYARVCAEVQSWPNNGWLPRGAPAFPFGPEAQAALELRNFLECTARIQGAQVLLMGICNLKEDGTTIDDMRRWIGTVATIANDYENVAIEVVNEYRHPNSVLTINPGAVESFLRIAKRNCPHCPVGADTGRGYSFDPVFAGLTDFNSAHFERQPPPTKEQITAAVAEAGGQLLLSETVAFNDLRTSDQDCGGLRTCNMRDIEDQIRTCRSVPGCDFVYHSICGLGWPDTCPDIGAWPFIRE